MNIKLHQISKSFLSGEQEVKILDQISFEIPAGEMLSIQGESGAGKSTLLSLLGLLDSPDQDRLEEKEFKFGETSVLGLSLKKRSLFLRRIGFIFQRYHLLPSLNLVQNVALPLKIAGQPNAKARAEEMLAKVGLSHRLSHVPSKISGGESQRACIARALVNSPTLILADEPTGNLDKRNREGVITLIKELAQKNQATLILVTHSKEIASTFPY